MPTTVFRINVFSSKDNLASFITKQFDFHSLGVIFYENILYKAQKCQYSPQKLTESLNRLIKKGYSYDTVVRSLKIAYFGVNIDSLIGSLHRN